MPERALSADAHAHSLALEEPQRGLDARAMRGQQFAAGLGVAEGECEADALGRAEREVPAADAFLEFAADERRANSARDEGRPTT
jgi:hypothetical protein